jgi:hypothetical protein
MSGNKRLCIRRRDETKHFLAVGDTGVGKTQFIKQLLYYAQFCGDSCVVLDSKLEFIPEFYSPERGDKILSPKDQRCVYWDIGNEVIDEADAISVTRALYPSHPNNSHAQFFDDQACKIAAFLLTHASAAELRGIRVLASQPERDLQTRSGDRARAHAGQKCSAPEGWHPGHAEPGGLCPSDDAR